MEEIDGKPAVELLKVFAIADPETGEKKFAWKFGGELNIYTMVGVLKSIIHNLLTQLQENTFQEKP